MMLPPPGDTLTIFRGRLSFKEMGGAGESRNYQPAEVLEADIELVPTANMPAVGAVDVICRGEMVRGLFWVLLCAATTGAPREGDALIGTFVECMNDGKLSHLVS